MTTKPGMGVGQEHETMIGRRRFVAGAAVIPASAAAISHIHDIDIDWASCRSRASGAKIRYPTTWSVDRSAHVNLLYPLQSFILRNGPRPGKSSDEYPALKSYPRAAVYLWLLHYSGVQLSAFAPRFGRIPNYQVLGSQPTEFAGFRRFGSAFSGSEHTYLLRLWVGVSATERTLDQLNRCLASLEVPSYPL